MTGADGFVGRRLVRALATAGTRCTALVRRPSAAPIEGVSYAVADCRDVERVHRVLQASRVDTVFHCAMTGGHPTTATERAEMLSTALVGTSVLLDAATAAGCERFVHACSGLIYAPQGRPLVESDPIAPTTTRGVAKAAAAHLVRHAGTATALHTVSLRIFSVYGPGESTTRFIPTLLRCARDATSLSLTPWPRHDFVHVDDVVAALRRAAVADVDSATSFNVSGGRSWSNADVVTLAGASTGRGIIIADEPFANRPVDAVVWEGAIDAARTALAWAPAISLAEGLRDFYRDLCTEVPCPT